MPFIQFQSHPLIYTLRRSLRAKRLHMILRQQQFEVVAPPKISNQTILQFVFSHKEWMAKHYHKQKRRQKSVSVWPTVMAAGEIITFRGKKMRLNIKFGQKKNTLLHQDSLCLTLPWQTPCSEIKERISEQLIAWYQKEAAEVVEMSVAHYCSQLGRWPKGVKLKQQKTRWGSCGIGEKIYLNWLLVLAPPGVLEYVVVHELCHLFYRNHGKRFWQKVGACMPHFEEYEKWLTQNGQSLKPII